MICLRATILALTAAIAASSCATSAPAGKAPARSSTLGRLGASKAEPYPACGAKNSYRFIAEDFVCPDGSNPFHGDLRAAASARNGNVGSHLDVLPENVFDSHIVDLYVVPCPSGPIQVYVCMYHCAKK